MADFKFSIITAIFNNERYLEESIESVINQDIGFKDNVQLILVDDGSTDKSLDIARSYEEKYPDNILALSKENGGVASARNLGLKHVRGKYVNFFDSDDKLSPNTLSVIDCFLKEHHEVNVVSMPLKFFDKREGDHYLNYKFEEEGIIDLDEKFDYPQMSMASSFVDISSIKDYEFNTQLVNGSDSQLLNRVLIDENRYGVVNKTHYNYRKRQEESSIMDTAKFSKRFFTQKMRLYYKHLIDECLEKRGEVIPYIQYLVLLDMGGIIKTPDFDNVFDTSEEINEFWQCMDDILVHIDENIILSHRYYNHDEKMFIIYLKNRDFHSETNPKKSKAWLKSNDRAINRLHKHNIHIDYIKTERNNLVVDGFFSSNCRYESLSIKAVTDSGNVYAGKRIESKYEDRGVKSYLGIDWKFKYNFSIKIPLNSDDFSFRLFVEFSEDDKFIEMFSDVDFKNHSNITQENPSVMYKSHNISFNDNEFHVVKCSLKDRLKSKFSG